MREYLEQLRHLLDESVRECRSNALALSGGLDSTVIAYYIKYRKPKTFAVIAKDFLATDLTYCQLAANKFNLELEIQTTETEALLSAIEETIKILKIFNDIEIRNAVVIYLVLQKLKELKITGIITGDGADELFAGYNFFLKKTPKELENELKRIWNVMHFPAKTLGESLGIKVESPFLNEKMIHYAKKLPVEYKVRPEKDEIFGKWILRKAFEDKIPKQIAWRQKAAMQDGSGTAGLTNLFEAIIQNDVFKTKADEIQKSDNVKLRTKESLHYYEIFRKYNDAPTKQSGDEKNCPNCNFAVNINSKFCRMCGSYPI